MLILSAPKNSTFLCYFSLGYIEDLWFQCIQLKLMVYILYVRHWGIKNVMTQFQEIQVQLYKQNHK